MKTSLWTLILPTAAGLACAGANPGGAPEGAPALTALDAIFADFAGPDGPGCAFAVSRESGASGSRRLA